MVKSAIYKTFRELGGFIPQLRKKITINRFSDPNAHVFFGYYDITPFSHNDKKILGPLACSIS